ncbi:AraC family transcriptional regulator [Sporolactobacillus sp. THM19-2]|uniref:helix-turn-helix domain-containing protein n=1 Tax=Sporolactobacillus sp. THM19-2 TaxID=2511171 RepID=UPI001021F654|nr:AraC family transcriptional regulator [Sporolactobacillus sp. THM19-2]RYL86392.1 AraC family transcriptional regulator [Sporolactobacillus sp. THM19-2]
MFNSYFPAQPEISKITDNYVEMNSAKGKQTRDIATFYQFRVNKESIKLISIIPDGCFDILICCSASHPCAVLWTSPFCRQKQLHFIENCTYFGVRFYPEQGLLRLKLPMDELLGQQVPLFDVMNIGDSLVEEIGTAHSFNERIIIFKRYLESVREDLALEQKIMRYSIDKIYSSSGKVSINDISRDIGYTPQYIRKNFKRYIGFPPKKFCEILKFQNIISKITIINRRSLMLDVTFENEYYDQSHFIREFKKMADLTPTQYLAYLGTI